MFMVMNLSKSWVLSKLLFPQLHMPWKVGISQALLRWVPPNGFQVSKYHLKAVSQPLC